MEVHFTPELERQLREMAAQSGKATDELVEDALRGYFDEVRSIRSTLDRRYDEMKNGAVKPVAAEEVEAYFRSKSAASPSRHRDS